MQRLRAFTLIELLVVIAIIAILAAILFPVFAKAKEAAHQAANISNFKQTGLSLAMYSADHEDTLPMSNPYNGRFANGLFGWGMFPNPVSANENAHEHGWVPAVLPYMKNMDILSHSSSPSDVGVWQAVAGHPGVNLKYNVVMNGYMNAYTNSEIVSPSAAISLWQGVGIVNYVNGTYAVLPLALPKSGTPSPSFTNPLVKFQRSGADCTVGWQGSWGQWHRSYYVHGEGFIAARTDGSAKWYRAIGAKETSPFRKLFFPSAGWQATTQGSMEAGESTDPYFNQDPIDGPVGCTYGYFFSPQREK